MLQAIAISCIAGILYGLSLLTTKKVLFRAKKPMLIGLLSALRLCLIAIFFYFMLKSNQMHPIILITSFLAAYWLTILKLKR